MNPEANLESFSFKSFSVDKVLILNPELDPDIHFFKVIHSLDIKYFFPPEAKNYVEKFEKNILSSLY